MQQKIFLFSLAVAWDTLTNEVMKRKIEDNQKYANSIVIYQRFIR